MHRVPVAVQGWDSRTELVDGVWVERTPRRPEVRAALLRETRLMPRLAPLLPVSVPVPLVVEDDRPWRVRHRLVPGEPGEPATLTGRDGHRVGAFLRVLHDTGFTTYAPAGVGPAPDPVVATDRLAVVVLPRLPEDVVARAEALLVRAVVPVAPVLVHGDLGPAHLLRTGCCVTGVIDWTDARLDDPAVDLAWVVHGTPAGFAAAVRAAYGPTEAEVARSRDHHALGPWHEVAHGVATGSADLVRSGTEGVVTRLRWLG